MTKETKYGNFCKFAKSRGLKDVTRVEYNTHVKQYPKLSPKGQLIRIRNDRGGRLSGGDRVMVRGYAVGARDFVYRGITIDTARSQFITMMEVSSSKEVVFNDYSQRGAWKGEHGHEFEIEADIGKRISKASNREYTYRDLKTWTQHDNVISPEMVDFRDLSDIGEDDQRTIVAVSGMISGIYPQATFEDGEISGEFDYDHGKFPTCTIVMKDFDSDITLSASMGPFKFSQPFLVDMEDWDIEACANVDELSDRFMGETIGIIGYITSVKDRETEDGDEYTQIYMGVSALFDLDNVIIDTDEEEDEREEEEDEEEESPGTDVEEMMNKLLSGVKDGINELGPGATVSALKKGKYVQPGISDNMIKTAMVMVIADMDSEKDVELNSVEQKFMDFISTGRSLSDLKNKFAGKKLAGRKYKISDVTDVVRGLVDRGAIISDGDDSDPWLKVPTEEE